MNKFILLVGALCGMTFAATAQEGGHVAPECTEWYSPKPPKVIPAEKPGEAPSDAIVLFDGKDLSKWCSPVKDGRPVDAKWKVEDGAIVIVPGSGPIQTREYFGDCQLHIEFKTPQPGPKNTLQMKGNSGIFLQSIYEVQVLDGQDNPTYVNGMVGSIYKQVAPLADVFTGTAKWQVYDIYWYKAHGRLPLLLQDHGVPVAYRNIWIRNL